MKDEEIKKPISRTELTPYSRGFADGEEFGVSKATSQTIQQVRDVLERYLKECKIQLKFNPLSDYWIGKEIGLEQVLSQLNNNHSQEKSLRVDTSNTNKDSVSAYNLTHSPDTFNKLGCGKDTEYYIGWDCNDNEIYLKCGEFSLTTGEIVYCPSCQRKKKETSNICKNCGKTKEEHLNDFCLEEYKPKMFQPSKTKLSEDEK